MQIGALGIAGVIYFATTTGLTLATSSFLSAILLVTAPLKRLTSIRREPAAGHRRGREHLRASRQRDRARRHESARRARARRRRFRSMSFSHAGEGTRAARLSLHIPAGRTVARSAAQAAASRRW
jgi:hypothetical protein